ncbi:type II toxin-antitoxin system Phd/YefM family antitoxin [Pandoraea sp.]|uniref:type II toxin-antitoxin system Phd/YefM family antitoxin n=1 Tax=Pandoraea sp. TaxID=1883445 RepID=UPI00120AD3F7|nr:type II toxin-antitoxin system prevent-host-death family antitoxin [Pandoraea sp.]TAL56929.1 MAG: type II toxin-antitoxin system prevent-host-death family antitoxin [Pandoraea sp.]TAM17723.1 MAG: type II toxin-antitoxin system prevent-host-death family antitoxin [Pandoraea sp.]
MYTEIGSFDAKARLSELLREVRHGQRYTITSRGQPVADLIPSESATQLDVKTAIEAMRSMRRVHDVPAETLREWIAEGRR